MPHRASRSAPEPEAGLPPRCALRLLRSRRRPSGIGRDAVERSGPGAPRRSAPGRVPGVTSRSGPGRGTAVRGPGFRSAGACLCGSTVGRRRHEMAHRHRSLLRDSTSETTRGEGLPSRPRLCCRPTRTTTPLPDGHARHDAGRAFPRPHPAACRTTRLGRPGPAKVLADRGPGSLWPVRPTRRSLNGPSGARPGRAEQQAPSVPPGPRAEAGRAGHAHGPNG